MSDQNQPYGDQSGNPYGNQPYDSPSDGSRPKGMAIAALIIGIVALLFSWTAVVGIAGGLLALVLGIVAARRAKQGRGGGRGMAITGAVLGVLGLLIGAAFVAVVVALFQNPTVQDLRDCLEQAGTDQSAIDQCQREAEDQVGN